MNSSPATNPLWVEPQTTNRTMSPSTAPISGAERGIGRLRNRSKMPFSMSVLRFTPIETAENSRVWVSRPGSTYCR